MDAARLKELLAPVKALSEADRRVVAGNMDNWSHRMSLPVERRRAYTALATLIRELPQ